MMFSNLHKKLFFLLIISFICLLIIKRSHSQDITVIKGDLQKPIVISSPKIDSWKSMGMRVFVCSDDTKISRGNVEILADKSVCWFYEDKATQSDEATLDIYFDGNVSLLNGTKAERHDELFIRLVTNTGLVIDTGTDGVNSFEEEQKSELFTNAKSVKQKAESSFAARRKSKDDQVFEVPATERAVNIFADEIDSWIEGDKRVVTAIGNVRIIRDDMVLNADNVILYFDHKKGGKFTFEEKDFDEMYAEGNVTLRQKEDVQIADKIFINLKENKGVLVDAQMQIKADIKEDADEQKSWKYGKKEVEEADEHIPTVHVKAEEIMLVGKGQYEINNGEFTTCNFDHPHYKFKSSKIRILKTNEQGVMSLAGNKVYWGNRSIFYWPYIAFDIRSKPNVLQNWELGNSSRYGNMLSTDWNLFNLGIAENIDKWSDLYFSLDYLEERGPGVGANYSYDLSHIVGEFDAYYIKDNKRHDFNSSDVEGEDRWRLSWRHRQYLPFDLRLDLEANNLSDDGFLREFYEKIFKEHKDEETIVYLRRLEDTEGITFLLKKQLNSFDTFVDAGKMDRVAERLPELGYRIIGEPLWKNRLNYTTESNFTYFDRVFSNIPGEEEPESAIRFDTNNEISSPFRLSILKVKPYVKGRFIGYTDTVKNKDSFRRFEDDGSSESRLISTVGVDMSTTLWRTYSYYSEFFDINRLRHVFTPEIRYSFNPFITKDPRGFNQYDSVDRIDDSQWLLIGFRNKLQTKRSVAGREKVVDLIYFDVELNFFLGNQGDDSVFDNEVAFNRKREDFIHFDFKAQLNDHISILSERNEFNMESGSLNIFNIGVLADYSPKWSAFLGQRFIQGVSSSVLLSTNFKFNEKWELDFLEQFDFNSELSQEDKDPDRDLGKNLKTKFVFTRNFHEWVGSFTAEFSPTRDETVTRFDVFPKVLQKKKKSSRFWF